MQSDTSEYFDKLFKDNYKSLVNISYRYTKRKTLAEEVVQDVFVDFWGRLDKKENILNHKAYLNRATVYRSLDTLKRERKYTSTEDEHIENLLLSSAGESSEAIHFSESTRTKLKQAVSKLPERTHEVFMLSKYENYSHNEISKILEIKKKTVEYHITKALLILRKALITLICGFYYFFQFFS